jgi:hypothetical protein
MLETCRDVVGEREEGAVSGNKSRRTGANRIEITCLRRGLVYLSIIIFIIPISRAISSVSVTSYHAPPKQGSIERSVI